MSGRFARAALSRQIFGYWLKSDLKNRLSRVDARKGGLPNEYVYNVYYKPRTIWMSSLGTQILGFTWGSSWHSNVTGTMSMHRWLSVWPATENKRSQIFEVEKRNRRLQYFLTQLAKLKRISLNARSTNNRCDSKFVSNSCNAFVSLKIFYKFLLLAEWSSKIFELSFNQSKLKRLGMHN